MSESFYISPEEQHFKKKKERKSKINSQITQKLFLGDSMSIQIAKVTFILVKNNRINF